MSDSFLLKFDYTFRPGRELHRNSHKVNYLYRAFSNTFLIIFDNKLVKLINIFVNFKILFLGLFVCFVSLGLVSGISQNLCP